jgi:hypothetical protein
VTLATEFTNAVHIIVPNGGHELLPDPAIRAVVADFFAGRDVRGRPLREDAPRFLPSRTRKSRRAAEVSSARSTPGGTYPDVAKPLNGL